MNTQKKIWEDVITSKLRDTLVFSFEIPEYREESGHEISVEIYWKRHPWDCYVPEKLYPGTKCKLNYRFDNGILIKGTLNIQKFSVPGSRHSHGIFGNFFYYENPNASYIWHTEGFLISYGKHEAIIIEEPEEVVIIDVPVIERAEVSPEIAEESAVEPNAYSDLFPYIYVSGWPNLSATEKKWNFFTYVPDVSSPPLNTFASVLAGLKTQGDRQGMQSQSVAFVEGTSPCQPPYLEHVGQLQGDIGGFLLYYEVLKASKNLTHVVAETCVYFGCSVQEFSAYLGSSEYLYEKEQLWSSYFALIILMGYNSENLEDIIKVLTLCNFLEAVFGGLGAAQLETSFTQSQLHELFYATVILYAEVFPLPPYTQMYSTASPPVVYNPVVPYAIGDLQLVQYKLLRYEIGELASITSIMPGERRKMVNRKLDRTVDKETTRTSSVNASVDVSNEQNSDFNEELWNTIAELTETTNYPDNGLISSYGPPTNITIQGTVTKTKSRQAPDQKQVSSFAKKILSKTTQRLSEKINKVRAHTELKEREDTSVSFLNNVHNDQPVYGIYCWLNKIYQAKVVNYGNRMLFSFIVPTPAAAYIRQSGIIDGIDLNKPNPLSFFGINTYSDIDDLNYLHASAHYRLKKIPVKAQQTVVVSAVVNLSQAKMIALPDGYCAKSIFLDYAFGAGDSEAIVNGFIGQNPFSLSRSAGMTGHLEFTANNEQGAVAVSTVYDAGIQMSPPDAGLDFQLAVEISCEFSPQALLQWQVEMYQMLENAYAQRLEAYNLTVQATHTREEQVNPLSRRLIIKQEMEKSIRQQLQENALYLKGLPESLLDAHADTVQYNQAEITQYLSQSLEWNEMSYTFYEQYDTGTKEFAVSALSSDFFSAYLKASYAQVIIPVAPAFNYGFLYFLSSGTVWSNKDRLAPCFPDNDQSLVPDQSTIVYELKETFMKPRPKSETIDKWEVLIPTSMQILQNKSSLKIKHHE